ncbi:nuclear receptor coactivator 5 isoform X2 [Leguminivora glycinivorella]|uniref:nuclear receptor coactivator 5 isoform X2 n=1 Tax=Leguminivora glycinivorella TaxID=1035111 RepID=UPI00200BDCF5|nr:nuclear receptor coactivator 5 isoform X2 [Leguminivora glycinivorella]
MADKLTLDRQAMKDRSTSHLRIYVGGITDNATVEDMYDHFIQYGQINGIVVNRNFGFVQFETEASAKQAIASADGSMFMGKTINVRTAQTNPDKARPTEVVIVEPEVPPAVVLTDNLPLDNDGGEEPYDSYGNYIGDQSHGGYKDREEEYEENSYNNQSWGEAPRGRGRGGAGARGRGRGRGRGAAPPAFRDREEAPPRRGGEWNEQRGYSRERYAPPPEYPRPVPVSERNDCEIIVVSKALTEYAEYIEGRLKRLGIVVDLLFPMEDVPIGKVLGNIASRGCLYAILVMPQNQENRSLTLTILHGLPQEHRNMPLEDALQLMSRNFQEVQRGGPSGREAVYALLGQLADGRSLTVMQYEKVIEYLQERKEQQVKIELGEPLAPASTNKTESDLQQRILSILNDKVAEKVAPVPAPVPAVQNNKLFNDPTVRKALDSILQKFT